MARPPKRSVSEEIATLQEFKEGVLALVQKHFGRKPRTATTARKPRSNGKAAPSPTEETFA